MNPKDLSRRSALSQLAHGGLGLATLLGLQRSSLLMAEESTPILQQPHFKPRAKHIIYLSMPGAPSHIDTFDYKPKLIQDNGKPGKYGNKKDSALLASPWEFKQQGQSGLWISSLFPHLSTWADELCLLHGMHCDQPNHSAAQLAAHTGNVQFIRPSLGAWVNYGLGTLNPDLPGHMVLSSSGSTRNHGSAFLPDVYQGTILGQGGRINKTKDGNAMNQSIANIKNTLLNPEEQRLQLDYIQWLNQNKLKKDHHQPTIEGIIQANELAYKMQFTLPKLLDISKERPETLTRYGIGNPPTNTFGRQCLQARKMVESGVRFIEISHGKWDHHNNLKESMEKECGEIDLPIAGLIADLKERDLLKDTLIIWAGEFGRTPHGQGGDGRDHNHKGYTTFMAGGGVKGGYSYGSTDEHGYEAVEGKLHTHDWHATILHIMGLDHEKLTYPHDGRNFRLTDVYGIVAKDILA